MANHTAFRPPVVAATLTASNPVVDMLLAPQKALYKVFKPLGVIITVGFALNVRVKLTATLTGVPAAVVDALTIPHSIHIPLLRVILPVKEPTTNSSASINPVIAVVIIPGTKAFIRVFAIFGIIEVKY